MTTKYKIEAEVTGRGDLGDGEAGVRGRATDAATLLVITPLSLSRHPYLDFHALGRRYNRNPIFKPGWLIYPHFSILYVSVFVRGSQTRNLKLNYWSHSWLALKTCDFKRAYQKYRFNYCISLNTILEQIFN